MSSTSLTDVTRSTSSGCAVAGRPVVVDDGAVGRHEAGRPELDPSAELRRDHRHEVGMLWRGAVSMLIVVVTVWIRQRYLR